MKKRLVKKKEKRIRKDIHKILDLVLDINGIESRKRYETGYKPTAFFKFSGHVLLIDVNVHELGWITGSTPEFNKGCYFDGYIKNETTTLLIKALEEEKRKLCRI